MTAVPPLTLPNGRVVAGWWRQAAAFHPEALWVGLLPLHRVEAPVVVPRVRRLDPVSLFLLKALAQQPGQTTANLDARLFLGPQLTERLLAALHTDGLADPAAGAWQLTPAGVAALQQGECRTGGVERQAFYFVDAGGPEADPQFFPLRDPPTLPAPVSASWRFDPRVLVTCFEQSPEWK